MADPSELEIVVGARGGLGAALVETMTARATRTVIGLARDTSPALDLLDETSIQNAAQSIEAMGTLRTLIIATGFLHGNGIMPEKALRQLDASAMAHLYAVNTIGPALVLKHFLPLLPHAEPSHVAVLSARVGSIGDNRLGGWHSYRAAKAALNQIVRTSAIELARTRSRAILVAVHPGTLDTSLSAPFARTGLTVQDPRDAAVDILTMLERLTPDDSGLFLDRHGQRLPA